ncbi:MAG TPA: hypothetical protein VF649_01090 [Sphingomonas sp.]|jgi:hypothetical protein|uniref:hypothetical protein n=1 Tax=Sphingomonas sp. TaxID=28214 RepID=UPI002ED9E177
MIRRTPPALALLLLSMGALVTSGCASTEGFPSLAPRPIEDIARRPERSTAAPVRAVDPVLDARVAAIDAQVTAAAGTWGAALATTRAAVDRARGKPIGDDQWVLAQQALSRLDSVRQAMGALVDDLDALRRHQAESPKPADLTQLDAAWARATTQAEAQDQAFRAVSAQLPNG